MRDDESVYEVCRCNGHHINTRYRNREGRRDVIAARRSNRSRPTVAFCCDHDAKVERGCFKDCEMIIFANIENRTLISVRLMKRVEFLSVADIYDARLVLPDLPDRLWSFYNGQAAASALNEYGPNLRREV